MGKRDRPQHTKLVTEDRGSLSRFLAVRKDVRSKLDDWARSTSSGGRHVAAATMATLLNRIRACEFDYVEKLLQNFGRGAVKNVDGSLVELGKNAKGGAPRVFLHLRRRGFIFVAAGVEEGSTGCDELEDARQRTNALSGTSDDKLRTDEDIRRWLGDEHYDIEFLNEPRGTRRC